MPALITDKLRKASNGAQPVVTTLASDKPNGTSTASLAVATGWNTVTAIDVIMYRIDANKAVVAGSQTFWVGLLSGTSLSSLTLRGGTEPANGYPADSYTVVECGPTAAWADDLTTALLNTLNPDGTLKTGVVATANIADSAVAAAKLADGAVTATKIDPAAISLGSASITTTFNAASGTAVQVTGLSVTVTIPAGSRKVEIEVWASYQKNNTAAASSYASIWDGAVGTGTQLAENAFTSINANSSCPCVVKARVSPAAGSKTYNVGLHADNGTQSASITATATSPAFISVKVV